MLASGSFDGGLTLWDIETGLPLAPPLKVHAEPLTSLSFSPDGLTLASGSAEAPLVVWSLDVRAWIDYACTAARRNLTDLEWKQYLGDAPYRETCPRETAQQPAEPAAERAGHPRPGNHAEGASADVATAGSGRDGDRAGRSAQRSTTEQRWHFDDSLGPIGRQT